MYQGSDTINGSLDLNGDVTPKVVLSPCLEDTAVNQSQTPQQEALVTYVEQQRQLLDVSPTGNTKYGWSLYLCFVYFNVVQAIRESLAKW